MARQRHADRPADERRAGDGLPLRAHAAGPARAVDREGADARDFRGAEFAIIFPDATAPSARDAANRFRELIEHRDFHVAPLGRTLHITVSVGVASYPRDGITSADLISRADEALYFAKKHGKNQVA